MKNVFPTKYWDFWQDGISVSFLNLFLEDKEQTRLAYVEGYRSQYIKPAIEFGEICHWLLASIYKTNKRPGSKRVKSLLRKYEKTWFVTHRLLSEKQRIEMNRIFAQAEIVLLKYFEYFNGEDFGRYKIWIDCERYFRLAYRYPDGAKTYIKGIFDGVFEKKKKLWLLETKTKGQIDLVTIIETLKFDLQTMLYFYHLYKLKHQTPAGILYNIIRRPGHKFTQKDTEKSFIDRVAKDVNNPKNKSHYFMRPEMYMTLSEIKDWKRDQLDPIMQEVRLWIEGVSPHYIKPNALVTKWGRCDLYQLIVNDRVALYKRNKTRKQKEEINDRKKKKIQRKK